MSSLRLALKQSLQESGGRMFSSGHGEKKKRKKKKNPSGGSNGNGSGNGSSSSGTATKRARDSAAKRKRGRPRKHPGQGSSNTGSHNNSNNDDDTTTTADQPRRRRPRQKRQVRPYAENGNNNAEDDDDPEAEYYSDDENEFSYTEDSSDEDSEEGEDDSDEDEEDSLLEDHDDEDDESFYRRRRSRASQQRGGGLLNNHRQHEEEEEEEDETMMHSDEDDIPSSSRAHSDSGGGGRKGLPEQTKGATVSETKEQRGTSEGGFRDPGDPRSGGTQGGTNHPSTSNRLSSLEAGGTARSLDASVPSNASQNASSAAVSAEEEAMRKKLKLLKLKKKVEKNQAANKIQTQWKKKKTKASSLPAASSGGGDCDGSDANSESSPSSSLSSTTTVPAPAESLASAHSSTTNAGGLVASTEKTTGATLPQNPAAMDPGTNGDHSKRSGESSTDPTPPPPAHPLKNSPGGDPSTPAVEDDLRVGGHPSDAKSAPGHSAAATTAATPTTIPTPASSSSTALPAGHNAAGDSGNAAITDDGDQDAPAVAIAKKKKKKNKHNNNGIVPAPTRDVREWAFNMSQKKCRKNIQVGMRVKVRFATQVKREGRLVQKKIYYGGWVTNVSKKRSRIKIKYDDGTVELTKFPDRDVVVDAVDNGEHAVLADKFIPPSPQQLQQQQEQQREQQQQQQAEKTTADASMAVAEEEGEILNAATMTAPPAAALPPPTANSATEDGEVEEDRKPQPCAVDTGIATAATEKDGTRTNGDSKESSQHATSSKKASATERAKPEPAASSDTTLPKTPATPPSHGSSSVALSKDETKNSGGASSLGEGNAHGGDDKAKHERASPAPSPEEGELSPGITFTKSTDTTPDQPEQQQQQPHQLQQQLGLLTKAVGDSKPLPAPKAFKPGKIEKPAEMETTITKSKSKPPAGDRQPPLILATKNNATTVSEREKSGCAKSSHNSPDISPFTKPKPTKKLSIRIPSNSLASIKGLSSPRSMTGTKTPTALPRSSSSLPANMDEILADTPEAKEENKATAKRKRASDDLPPAPSVASSGVQDPPPKRRIKVALGGRKLMEAIPTSTKSQQQQSNDAGSSKAAAIPDNGPPIAKNLQQQHEEAVFEEVELAPPMVEEPQAATGENKKKKKKGDRAKSPRPKSPITLQRPEKNKSTNPPEAPLSSTTPKQQKIGSSKGSAFTEKKSVSNEEGTTTTTGTKQSAAKSSNHSSAVVESIGASVPASLRIGRKAAEEAKEKLSAKQKAKLNAKEVREKNVTRLDSGKKKKKRKRKEELEEHGAGGPGDESDAENENEKWVQCDSCEKWRVLPDNIKSSSLPTLWYCHMNVYDPKRNTCEAPEQDYNQVMKQRKKRARKRAKREQAVMAESLAEKSSKKNKQQQLLEEEQKQQQQQQSSSIKKKSKQEKLHSGSNSNAQARSCSPKTTKGVKSAGGVKSSKESGADSKKALTEAKRSNHEGGSSKKSKGSTSFSSEEQHVPTDSGSDTQKEIKKKGKKAKKEQLAQAAHENSEHYDADDSKKSGRKRGRPARNNQSNTCTPVPTASSSSNNNDTTNNNNEDEDNVEWVQCDKCEKWRKLPPDISADELPDIWNCSMNTWNPRSASCEADEDKTDVQHTEVGASEWQLRQTHAGKYSYRQMIFGTGARKHNRPMSERARAAESLFIQPSTDEEHPHPTTQYTKSSAFLPRVSNFQKANGGTVSEENNALGIFDVLKHSNLWEDLRTMDLKPHKVLSSYSLSLASPPNSSGSSGVHSMTASSAATTTAKLRAFESLSDDVKHAMQDIVLQTLEFGCLTGNEVVRKAQCFPYETSLPRAGGIKGYCNPDIIVHTLLDLVRDGLVEMAAVRDPLGPITQWVPRYRRVGTRRALEAFEAIKASRCMKISKPWKQRTALTDAASSGNTTQQTEFVTGQRAN